MSHGLARIAEFLPDDDPQVVAVAFASARLAATGDERLLDELRVIVRASSGSTAYFTFSSQMRPLLHEFRVVRAEERRDPPTRTTRRSSGAAARVTRATPTGSSCSSTPRGRTSGMSGSTRAGFSRTISTSKGRLKHLIECFYRSIGEDDPPPIPYREIVMLTSRLMDSIFAQVYRREPQGAAAPGQESPVPPQCVPSPG